MGLKNLPFFIALLAAFLGLQGKAMAQHKAEPKGAKTEHPYATLQAQVVTLQSPPDSTEADSAANFGTLFLAEPGDTLMVFESSPYDSIAFAERDTVNMITDVDLAHMVDTLDFRNYVPTTPYDLIADRVSCLQDGMEMPLTFNKTVNSFINFFTVRKRDYTQGVLERRDYFFPLFEEKLKKYGLPDELKYLSIVESALHHRAVSRSSAVGLWQFMAPTGRDLRLYQDKYIDERMDPDKATEAACKYLKFLYGLFGDWELSLAAYNCGPGAIKRTMQRTGGKTFWDIYNSLPAETRSYVPQFVAVTYTMNYAAEHNLYANADSLMRKIQGDTVVVDRQVNLVALSKHLQVDVKHLVQLNPTLRKPVTPENVPFVLNLPTEAADRFRRERSCFLDSCMGLPLADSESGFRTRGRNTTTLEGHRLTHRIRRRETLTEIAKDYHVALSDLKHWNHLRSGRVRQGQVLVIYSKSRHHKVKEADEEAVAKHQPKHSKADKDAQTHEVQPGDTLWNISKRYEGLTVEKLIQLNNLKDKNLKPGQKLILG